MGYKALITLDLNNSTEEQRALFYEVLKDENWTKIPKLTTTWKCSFYDTANRVAANNTIIAHLNKAKLKSKISQVDYAFQLDKENVQIGIL
jgi:hypothetical protein